MDFNLSSICDMLGDRIEEYKTTSKKRRIERGSCAPKAKIAKFTHENQIDSSVKKHGTRMYASTPIETPKTESQQLSTAMYSSIKMLPGTPRNLSRNLNLEAKKSPFEVEDYNEVGEKSKVENSEVSFSSATKTIKRRRVQRIRLNAKRLLFDDDDQNNDECLSKDSAHIEPNMYDKCLFQDSVKIKPNIGNKCLFQDSLNNVECKSVECLSKDSNSDSLTKVLTPLYTPKRPRLPRKSMIARRLTFDESENEDTCTSVYYSVSNEWPSEEMLDQIKSPLEIPIRSYKDPDLVESLPNDCDTTLNPNSEEMDSTILVLNVGILIRPIRDVSGD